MARACNDPSIARWTQVPQPYHLENARVHRHPRQRDHDGAIDVDVFAGAIGIRATMATMPGPITEVGYWVAPCGRADADMATQALIAVRDELARVGYQRIDWEALAGNEASIRVARNAGFTIEGSAAKDWSIAAAWSTVSSAGGQRRWKCRSWWPGSGRSSPSTPGTCRRTCGLCQ